MKRIFLLLVIIAAVGSAGIMAQAAHETVDSGDVMLAVKTLTGTVSVKDGIPMITSGGADYVLYYNRVRAAELGIEEGQTVRLDGFELPSSHTLDDRRYFLVSKVYLDGVGHLIGIGVEQGRLVVPAEDLNRLIPVQGMSPASGYGAHTRLAQRLMTCDDCDLELCPDNQFSMAYAHSKGGKVQTPAVPHRMAPPAAQQFQDRAPQHYKHMYDRQAVPQTEPDPVAPMQQHRGFSGPRMRR